jgi:membrane associated rhomboid family serine protease
MCAEFRGSPTTDTLVIFVIVFVLQRVIATARPFAHEELFILGPSFTERPWTLVTSIYAHGDVVHLFSNALLLALIGYTLERQTSRGRFHGYFVSVGVLAGLAQVLVSNLAPTIPSSSVLGASGAVLALYGYVFTANTISRRFLSWLKVDARYVLALFAVLAAAVTLMSSTSNAALLAHFTGFFLGLVGGSLRVLSVERRTPFT